MDREAEMNGRRILSLIALAAALAGGCRPEESIWWSPDGQTASIRCPDGLRLADASGRLSDLVLTGLVHSARWFADGSALLVNRTFNAVSWGMAESMIPPAEAAAARRLARIIADASKSALIDSGGSTSEIRDRILAPLELTELTDLGRLAPLFSLAAHLHRDELLAAVALFPNANDLKAGILEATNGIPIHEITLMKIREGKEQGVAPMFRSLLPIRDAMPSPKHAMMAVIAGNGTLKAVSLHDTNAFVVAARNVRAATWSTDGRALIYLAMGESDRAGEIHRQTVLAEDGAVIKDADARKAQPLALVAFDLSIGPPKLVSLPDGRVLFASAPISLPAAGSPEFRNRLFLLNPAKPGAPVEAVPFDEKCLITDFTFFVPSPEGRRVALVEAGSDAVVVVDLQTGTAETVSAPHEGWKSRLIPAWRNSLELSFAAPPSATAARPELQLWRSGIAPRVLSQEWPDGVVKQWLEAPNRSNP